MLTNLRSSAYLIIEWIGDGRSESLSEVSEQMPERSCRAYSKELGGTLSLAYNGERDSGTSVTASG